MGGSSAAQRVFIVQKQILRTMLNMGSMDTCRGAFKSNSMLTIFGIYIYECTLFVVKNRDQFAPHEFTHKYPTRFRGNYQYPSHHLTVSQKLPHYSMIKFYNKLPLSLKEKKAGAFKTELFKYISEIEPYSVREFLEYGGNV